MPVTCQYMPCIYASMHACTRSLAALWSCSFAAELVRACMHTYTHTYRYTQTHACINAPRAASRLCHLPVPSRAAGRAQRLQREKKRKRRGKRVGIVTQRRGPRKTKAHIWEKQRESCTHAKTHDIVYSAFSDTKLHGLSMSMCADRRRCRAVVGHLHNNTYDTHLR
jgi:hypothetical protein